MIEWLKSDTKKHEERKNNGIMMKQNVSNDGSEGKDGEIKGIWMKVKRRKYNKSRSNGKVMKGNIKETEPNEKEKSGNVCVKMKDLSES